MQGTLGGADQLAALEQAGHLCLVLVLATAQLISPVLQALYREVAAIFQNSPPLLQVRLQRAALLEIATREGMAASPGSMAAPGNLTSVGSVMAA